MPAYRIPPWRSAPPEPPAPLAPIVDLMVSWNNRPPERVLAILDTGADQTQIPLNIALALRLRKLRDKPITDANGQRRWQPVYAAKIEFDGIAFDNLSVIGSPFPFALIGRDVLNQVAVLDGPRLTVSLTPV